MTGAEAGWSADAGTAMGVFSGTIHAADSHLQLLRGGRTGTSNGRASAAADALSTTGPRRMLLQAAASASAASSARSASAAGAR